MKDERMANAVMRNLTMFRKLCGDNAFENVVLVTTVWDNVRDQRKGMSREKAPPYTRTVGLHGNSAAMMVAGRAESQRLEAKIRELEERRVESNTNFWDVLAPIAGLAAAVVFRLL